VTRIRRQDALRYLKISPAQLRGWERKGLVCQNDSYTLEECGQLRTLRDLSARYSLSKISASLGAMKIVVGAENPLLEARAVGDGQRVHFRYRGHITEPIAKQFVFDFDAYATSASHDGKTGPIAINRDAHQPGVADLFVEAVRHEDAEEFDDAVAIYERIIEKDPHHAPACINLGTICYNRRKFARAEELYRRATIADSGYALAFFDLGNVLDEMKRLPEAVTAYRTAIRIAPNYADAHYNLALAFERMGERRWALRHWTAYLKLDPSSRWANHARNQVRTNLDRETLRIVHRTPRGAQPRLSGRLDGKTLVQTQSVPSAG
jgi:tetratricopeptide (TPR) repeat protein